MLFPPGIEIDHAMIPMMHWQSGLFGRGTQNLVLRNQLSQALAALDRELQIVGDIQDPILRDWGLGVQRHFNSRVVSKVRIRYLHEQQDIFRRWLEWSGRCG